MTITSPTGFTHVTKWRFGDDCFLEECFTYRLLDSCREHEEHHDASGGCSQTSVCAGQAVESRHRFILDDHGLYVQHNSIGVWTPTHQYNVFCDGIWGRTVRVNKNSER